MALVIASKNQYPQANAIGAGWYISTATVAFDNAYATGGESLTAADLGFPVGSTIVLLLAQPRLGFSFEYDYTGKKLLAYCPGVVTTAAGAGVLDDFPLSGVGATAASIGLTAGNATTRFGGQVEVAAAADLSTVTTRVVAFANYGS